MRIVKYCMNLRKESLASQDPLKDFKQNDIQTFLHAMPDAESFFKIIFIQLLKMIIGLQDGK